MPSGIKLLNNNKNIGFIYEFGMALTKEDIKFMENDAIRDENGNYFMYYGKLTKISKNVYGSKGNMYPSMKDKIIPISSTVDFYIKLEDSKTYFIFEDLSKEELINYSNDNFIECE